MVACAFAPFEGTVIVIQSLPPLIMLCNSFVIGDNMWFWRADHTASGTADIQYNPVRNGLVVRGDDVTMYGLAVEHALEDLVQWSGERGCVALFFYCRIAQTGFRLRSAFRYLCITGGFNSAALCVCGCVCVCV